LHARAQSAKAAAKTAAKAAAAKAAVKVAPVKAAPAKKAITLQTVIRQVDPKVPLACKTLCDRLLPFFYHDFPPI
jgi:hypothetical protein